MIFTDFRFSEHIFLRTLKKLLVQNAPVLLWNGMRMKSEIEPQQNILALFTQGFLSSFKFFAVFFPKS